MFSNIMGSSLQTLLGKVLQDGESAHLSKNMSVEDSQIHDEQGKHMLGSQISLCSSLCIPIHILEPSQDASVVVGTGLDISSI